MTNDVLYYPFINVPIGAWLARALLYWDKVGSIVPSALGLDGPISSHYLESYMRDLMENGLVIDIAPEKYHFTRKFETTFVKRIEKLIAQGVIEPKVDHNYLPDQAIRLYNTKMSHRIIQLLHSSDLAWETNNGWYQVERKTADLYMSYLANYLAQQPNVKMIPITDTVQNLSLLTDISEVGDDESDNVGTYRSVLIENAFPVSRTIPHPAKLARFKEDFGEQLRNFRLYVDDIACKIAGSSTEELGDLRASFEKERMRRGINDLVKQLNERSTFPRESFMSYGGIVASSGPLGLGLASIPVDPVKVGFGVLGLGLAVSKVLMIAHKPNIDMSAPLSYAAIARTQRNLFRRK